MNGAQLNVRIMNGDDPAGARFAAPGTDAAALSTKALRVQEIAFPDGRHLTAQ